MPEILKEFLCLLLIVGVGCLYFIMFASTIVQTTI
jgi:hypothetical protein